MLAIQRELMRLQAMSDGTAAELWKTPSKPLSQQRPQRASDVSDGSTEGDDVDARALREAARARDGALSTSEAGYVHFHTVRACTYADHPLKHLLLM